MKLEVHERIALLQLIPLEGDYAALKTLRRAREMLSFTPEELKYLEMRNETGADGKMRTIWNVTRAAEAVKDCPVDEYTTSVFRNKLAEMDRKNKLTEQYMSVYEKFVVMYS